MTMSLDVKVFQNACDQEPSEKNAELYYKLIKEEFEEFRVAHREKDEVEMLDACMDMIWVILGYCYMKGFDVEGAWKEVARSNLEKINPETNKVMKREDGKVLKPDGWTPPNLVPYLPQQN